MSARRSSNLQLALWVSFESAALGAAVRGWVAGSDYSWLQVVCVVLTSVFLVVDVRRLARR